MDLAYLTGQPPADSIKPTTADLTGELMLVNQGKTGKKLRIRLRNGEQLTGLGVFIAGLLERRKEAGIQNGVLVSKSSGLRMSCAMLWNRWDEVRSEAAQAAEKSGAPALADRIRQFQLRDIPPQSRIRNRQYLRCQ